MGNCVSFPPAGGDELPHFGGAFCAGAAYEGLADEDGVAAHLSQAFHVRRSMPLLGDDDLVAGDLLAQVGSGLQIDLEGAQVAVVDADDTRRRQGRVRSATSCTSTRASMPRLRVEDSSRFTSLSPRTAMMSSSASAPATRASYTWYS